MEFPDTNDFQESIVSDFLHRVRDLAGEHFYGPCTEGQRIDPIVNQFPESSQQCGDLSEDCGEGPTKGALSQDLRALYSDLQCTHSVIVLSVRVKFLCEQLHVQLQFFIGNVLRLDRWRAARHLALFSAREVTVLRELRYCCAAQGIPVMTVTDTHDVLLGLVPGPFLVQAEGIVEVRSH